MKVSELMGVSLDYWVANAEELPIEAVREDSVIIGTTPNRYVFAPTQKWDQGGPIIEREGITTYRNYIRDGSGDFNGWIAAFGGRMKSCDYGTGPTPLIAAMRAYVASKFGDTVPDL